MKLCAAQVQPVKGAIATNIKRHLLFIDRSATFEVDLIIFPELSLTGYEPSLAASLATDLEDERLNVFQLLSDKYQMTICVGMPLRHESSITISMIIFQPLTQRIAYHKEYLHKDEEVHFVSRKNMIPLIGKHEKIAFSICYELSIPKHAEDAFKRNASIYIASVAKSKQGMESATQRLAAIAKQYSMMVIVSNCIGDADDFVCSGNSAAWTADGKLLVQLSETEEGLLIIDTKTSGR